eukprot:CAMPEP_0117769516 /NCGR_PEP_ID=MMETSP0947-20121206/23084_1 /TAXON_ID=44440 /ORGANISM="Chattonella subsalsa, Strain CCMP2191" /LENGTH=56 /DNA_ID=CAMNT_0005594037 /DNA_START=134 /DNA_END=301 /DNA_ORIENTATION=-
MASKAWTCFPSLASALIGGGCAGSCGIGQAGRSLAISASTSSGKGDEGDGGKGDGG